MPKKLLTASLIGIFLLSPSISAQTWEPAKRLTHNSATSHLPAIATDSKNQIHLVLADNSIEDNYEIFYKKSTDGGASWTTKRLTYNSGYSTTPDIAANMDNDILVVWDDNASGQSEIYFKKSTNGGSTWTSKRLTWSPLLSVCPSIAVGSNNHIHIVWQSLVAGSYEIYYRKSADGGSTWTKKRLCWNSGHSIFPVLALDSNNHIHVTWIDNVSGNYEVYYKKSTDGGKNWTTKRLTYNSGYSERPAIAVDSSDNIHVVWQDDTPGNGEVFHKKSTDGGKSWKTKRLTYNSLSSWEAAIAVDFSGNIHVVWEDMTPGNFEIYYKKSIDGGVIWKTRRLTWNPGISGNADLAIDADNNIHLVWQEKTPGNWQIYYMKGIQ